MRLVGPGIGPLQAKIMMMLSDEALCGVDIMKRLRIKSPGTIYPVLEVLRRKRVVEYRVEQRGAIRKKMYFLTKAGREQLREQLGRSARMFCCDLSLHINRILENMKELVQIKRHQKILCTVEYDEVKRFLRGADATFSEDLNVPPETYELAISFRGVRSLIGKKMTDITEYADRLFRSLKRGGSLLAIEIEKTDNLFARFFFEDIVGLKNAPGLRREELESVLRSAGFKPIEVTSKSGLLYAVSYKP